MRASIVLIFIFLFYGNAKAQLVINEFMQSNIDCIVDDLNEFPDSWVELFNAGEEDINLDDFSLSIQDEMEKAWILPDSLISPKSFVVIFCDKVANGLHTDFRLDSGKGGAIILYKGSEIADRIDNINKQPAPNISYGRKFDGKDEWGYQYTSTPNQSNCGIICSSKKILPPPIFDKTGFITTSNIPFELKMSVPEEAPKGAEIYYTLDGKEPTKSDIKYVNPINITSTTIIRAKLICDGYLSPRATTNSYIFFPRKITLPVISISTNEDYLYDSNLGILVEGGYSDNKENYQYNWRRPVNLEFFRNEDSQSQINQLCELRVMGGSYSRQRPIKPLAVYAHKRFGKKYFEYPFFPNDKPDVNIFKSFLLRNSGNDFYDLYMLDAIVQRSMGTHADLDWQAWQPAVVFLNGNYSGIMNIRERSNEDNIYSNYNGLDNIDMVENWTLLKEGSLDEYEKFRSFYNEEGHSLAEYTEWVDWKEFQNLMIMNLFFNNQDFPGNNIVLWRPRFPSAIWRFVAKDCDFGLGHNNTSASYNTIEWLYNNNYDPIYDWGNTYSATLLFRRLMEIDDFKNDFIDKAAIYIGDFLNVDGIRKIWRPMYDAVKYEYNYHQELYDIVNPLSFEERFSNMDLWVKERTPQFINMLKDYYGLGSVIPLKIYSNDDKSPLSFNGVKLFNTIFDGFFFADRRINLESEDINIEGWRVIEEQEGIISDTYYNEPTLSITLPKCKGVEIYPITNATVLNENHYHNWTYTIVNNELMIEHLQRDQMIRIYSPQGFILYSGSSKDRNCRISLTKYLKGNGMFLLKIGSKCVKVFKN